MKPNETEIEIENVGLVLFKSSTIYKRMIIKLKPFEGIVVTFPESYNIKRAIKFVNSKKDWINKSKEKIKKQEQKVTVFDENSVFETRSFKLKVQTHKNNDVLLRLENGILKVFYPENIPVSNSSVQEAIRFGIEKAMRIEAKKTLPAKVMQLAAEHGFKYKKVSVKNLKSRWGSCSSDDNINLNIQLMRLPDYLVDYVIFHELCHTVEKNHGAEFWKLLNKCTDNKAKSLAKEMNFYKTCIY